MSWFHESEVYVNVITNKLTDADTTPIKNAAVSSVLRDADMTNNITAVMMNGLGAKAKRFYKYAEKGNFMDGLPEVTLGINNLGNNQELPEEPIPFPGAFYPIVSIRDGGTFLTKESDEPRYDSSRKTLKRTGLRLTELISNIEKDDREDENGDVIPGNPVNELDDVFFLYGLDLYTQHPESIGYMYDFCELLDQHAQMTQAQFHTFRDAYESPPGGIDPDTIPSNAIFLKTKAEEFDVIINFDYVYQNGPFNGLLIPDGETKPDNLSIVTKFIPETYTSPDSGTEKHVDPSTIAYHKQLTRVAWGDASDTYGTYTLVGIAHETHVKAYGAERLVFRTIGDKPNGGGQPTGTYDTFNGLPPGDDDYGRSGIYFPLCKDILELRHSAQEEEVLVDAMMLAMHAAEEVELKWYQQTWFKIVMVAITAVLMYYGLGKLAIEAMNSTAALFELAATIGIGFIVEMIATKIGGTLGLVIAAVAAVYLVKTSTFSAATTLLPQADKLLKAVAIVTSLYEAKVKQDIGDLREEVDEYDDLIKSKKQAIHEAYAMMGANQQEFNFLDLLIEDMMSAPELTPSEFYATAKTTNVAAIVKESISEYHSNMKMLPDATQQSQFTA